MRTQNLFVKPSCRTVAFGRRRIRRLAPGRAAGGMIQSLNEMIMKRILYIWLVLLLTEGLVMASGFSLTESAVLEDPVKPASVERGEPHTRVFGWNLFQGNFKENEEPWYNPEYRIHIGDMINLRFWGALEYVQDIPVDSQGNIFIPKVGNVMVLGVKNSELVETVRRKIRTVYKEKVHVYANVANYQPITVFVTGNVNKPGLYQGMSSDSVLQFLDKARGINPEYGSFRDIEILRGDEVVGKVDLYSFLTRGALTPFQFKSGDVISVKTVMHRISVTGDVKKPYSFEFKKREVKLSEVLDHALLNPTATNVTVTRWERNNKKTLESFSLESTEGLMLHSGDTLDVYPDHVRTLNTITIAGEHDGRHTLLVKRDATLGDLVEGLKLTPRSEPSAIQLFRKSVAAAQKQILDAKLKKLEELILTTPSVTKEESLMRTQENKGILAFIDRARKIKPKGQIVINEKTDLHEIFLEDGDRVFIPTKSNLVLVQGEVAFPGAHTYVEDMTAKAYIDLAGDLTDRANPENILVLHQNGRVVKCDSEKMLKKMGVKRGDAVLVLPKMGGKNLLIAKDVTQILYQVAISAGVLVAL